MSGKQEKLKIKKRKRDQQEKVQKNASNGLAEPETVEEMQEQMQERVNKIRKTYINKQRTLVLSSRGITSRFRHLMEDVCNVMPHSKKDVKLDTKDQLWVINEICDMKSCNNCIFFECRKKQDLFMWVVRAPHGPSMKFRVLNGTLISYVILCMRSSFHCNPSPSFPFSATIVHTMDELKFTGNSLKGSRPILSFDAGFDSAPQYKLMKELLTQAFGTPKGHPKSKPFIDHVFSFNLADGKIWFRNFQVCL
jgi:ribosome biogenesis protein BRX1